MVLMAGMDLPIRAIREQVASAVDLIVHQTRFKDGSRRITHITEVERMEGDVITLQDVFLFDHAAGFDSEGRYMGTLKPTGLRPKFLDKMAARERPGRPDAVRDGTPLMPRRLLSLAPGRVGDRDARPARRPGLGRGRRVHRSRQAHQQRRADPRLGARGGARSTSTASP